MVIDWNRQIDECIRNTKIMPIFNGRPKSYMYEHRLIIKRLSDAGYSDMQIANWMILADSTIIHDSDDVEFVRKHYGRLIVPKRHDFKIFITMDEIRYIDSLKTSKENKSYLLSLICYLKMMKVRTNRPVIKPCQSAYIYYLAFGTDDYWHGKMRGRWISKFIKRLCDKKIIIEESKPTRYTRYTSGGPVKELINDTKMIIEWVNWDATDGYCIQNPEVDIRMLADRAFKDPVKHCVNCGNEFIVTPHTKTKLCPKCQKSKRQSDKNDWFRNHPEYKHDKHKTHSHGLRDAKAKKTKGKNVDDGKVE